MTLIDICEEMVQEGDDNGGCGITPMMFSVIKIIGSRLDAKNLIERFIRKTHNHWGNIQERNIDYFKQVFSDILNIATERGMENVLDNEDKKITGELNMTHVGLFKRLLSMNYVVDNEEINLFNDERIDMTWKIMHNFYLVSISAVFLFRFQILIIHYIILFVDKFY